MFYNVRCDLSKKIVEVVYAVVQTLHTYALHRNKKCVFKAVRQTAYNILTF